MSCLKCLSPDSCVRSFWTELFPRAGWLIEAPVEREIYESFYKHVTQTKTKIVFESLWKMLAKMVLAGRNISFWKLKSFRKPEKLPEKFSMVCICLCVFGFCSVYCKILVVSYSSHTKPYFNYPHFSEKVRGRKVRKQ